MKLNPFPVFSRIWPVPVPYSINLRLGRMHEDIAVKYTTITYDVLTGYLVEWMEVMDDRADP